MALMRSAVLVIQKNEGEDEGDVSAQINAGLDKAQASIDALEQRRQQQLAVEHWKLKLLVLVLDAGC